MNKQFIFELKGNGNSFYGFIKIKGNLEDNAYESFVPMFQDIIKDIKEPKVKLLVDITELSNWNLADARDDIKFGLCHNNDFEKIAIVGNSSYYKFGLKIANWFTIYDMKYFSDINEAHMWLDI